MSAFNYKETGAGPAVVFIQGVGLHGDGWIPQTSVLRKQFRCVSFDNREAAPFTVEQMAADTLAVMDAAGTASAHLVGHSLGGVIAQQVALTSPGRVLSLSLLCTSAVGADATKLSWTMLQLGLRSRIGSKRMRREAFLQIIATPAFLATQDKEALALNLAPLFGHDLADSPPSVLHQLAALKTFNSTSRLHQLAAIPTLVLSAEHDVIFPPRCGKALADGIPGATFLEIRDAGHGVPILSAEIINQALAEHFSRAH